MNDLSKLSIYRYCQKSPLVIYLCVHYFSKNGNVQILYARKWVKIFWQEQLLWNSNIVKHAKTLSTIVLLKDNVQQVELRLRWQYAHDPTITVTQMLMESSPILLSRFFSSRVTVIRLQFIVGRQLGAENLSLTMMQMIFKSGLCLESARTLRWHEYRFIGLAVSLTDLVSQYLQMKLDAVL